MERSPILEALPAQSPTGMRHNNDPGGPFTCCCGRPNCLLLAQNNAALERLEKDLRAAAQVGQVCLTNHGCDCPLPAWLGIMSKLLSFLVRGRAVPSG